MSDVDICNQALASLDVDSIDALSDESKPARKLNAIYTQKRDSLIASHPWNFATKRIYLDRAGTHIGTGLDDLEADVDDYTGSNPLFYRVQIDAEATPDTFKWSKDGGSTWETTGVAITGADQTLDNDVTIIFDATTGHTSGDYWDISAPTEPRYDFNYKYKLPDDYLRKARTNLDTDEFKIEGNYLVTSEGAVKLEYIAQITDTDEYSVQFIEALSARLAAEVCFALTDSRSLTEVKWKEYEAKLRKAKSEDAQESNPAVKEESSWINARG